MNIRSRRLQKLLGLFVLALVLFNHPVLSIFNREIFIAGIPLLFFYLFIAWFFIVFLLIVVIERRSLLRMPKNIETQGE